MQPKHLVIDYIGLGTSTGTVGAQAKEDADKVILEEKSKEYLGQGNMEKSSHGCRPRGGSRVLLRLKEGGSLREDGLQ